MNEFYPNKDEQVSTPKQAEDIFTNLLSLVEQQGENRGDRNIFTKEDIVIPDRIVKEIPFANMDPNLRSNLYASLMLDRTTGRPVQNGMVGRIIYSQSYRLINGDAVNEAEYDIFSGEDGTFSLERKVKTSHPPERFGRDRDIKHYPERPVNVTETEAQQIVETLVALNSAS